MQGRGRLSLSGSDAGNYEIITNAASVSASADITKKKATITAHDQTIKVNGSIAKGVYKVTADGLVAGCVLSDVSLKSSSTSETMTSGSITPSGAVIKSGDKTVTGNYDLSYINGVLKVEKESLRDSNESSSSKSSSKSSSSSSSGGNSSSGGPVNYDELYYKLSNAIAVINAQKAEKGIAGVEQQIVTWDKGESLP